MKWGKNKKIHAIFVFIAFFSAVMPGSVFADDGSSDDYQPGVYIGVQAGYARTNEGDGPENYLKQLELPSEKLTLTFSRNMPSKLIPCGLLVSSPSIV